MSVQSETSHWPFSLLPTTTTVPSFLSPAVLNSPVLMATISVHLEILHRPKALSPAATTVPSALSPIVMVTAGADGDDIRPVGDVTLAGLILPDCDDRTVFLQPHRVPDTGAHGDYIRPA